MQIKRLSYGIKGFVRITDYALRLSSMEQAISDTARKRAKIIQFWRRYGLQATTDAYGVKRSTLFAWQKRLRESNGDLRALNPYSKSPRHTRTRQWHSDIITELKQLRTEHPNLGKDKIHPLLKEWCRIHHMPCPSVSTIGRLIADDPKKMRITPVKVRHNGQIVQRTRVKKTRKPKGFKAQYPGHCGAFDTVERFVHGTRRYVITFTDLYSRFCFAWSTTSHASQAALEVLQHVQTVFPHPLINVLTDNGSEFMKHFDVALKKHHKVHWHTYPRTPKMNAHNERFNRTIQEEFIDYHVSDLLDPDQFNIKLIDYLIWYNTKRPHHSLNMLSPLQFILQNHPESRMGWTHTVA